MKMLKPATIRNRRREYHQRRQEAVDQLDTIDKLIRKEEVELRERCPHERVWRYIDAAGGPGSHYECRDCGRCSHSEFGTVVGAS
jgi:hypothetical protein